MISYAWLKFIICTGIIFLSGKRVAKYGDIIAEKTGLGGLWIGVVLVAITTSLPEIFTGVGSTVFVNAPNLTIGNILGANTYNLLNVATLDLLGKSTPLLSVVSSGQLLTAGLSLIPLSIACIGIFLTPKLPYSQISFGSISLFSVLILIFYLACAKTIFKFEKNQKELQKELAKEEGKLLKYENTSFKKACIYYGIFAVIIAVAGIWLAYIGDELAIALGFGQSFIGSLFLGFATTLPEITVSVAALRIGAKELALANLLGSNLFNIAIIFLNDLLYRRQPIFKAISQQHIFTAFIIIIMTILVIAGLVIKPKKKYAFGLSAYSIGLIIVFIIGAYINYILGAR